MPDDDLTRALGYVTRLYRDLAKLLEDPDQEIGEREYALIDTILTLGLPFIGDDPVTQQIRALFSPETIAADKPIRAAEVYITTGSLKHRLERAQYDQPGATRLRALGGLRQTLHPDRTRALLVRQPTVWTCWPRYVRCRNGNGRPWCSLPGGLSGRHSGGSHGSARGHRQGSSPQSARNAARLTGDTSCVMN